MSTIEKAVVRSRRQGGEGGDGDCVVSLSCCCRVGMGHLIPSMYVSMCFWLNV